jgi:hypothetical protein
MKRQQMWDSVAIVWRQQDFLVMPVAGSVGHTINVCQCFGVAEITGPANWKM